eukprot:2078995-Amphidinium_carterae.1
MTSLLNDAETRGCLPRLCQTLWQTAMPKIGEGLTAKDVRPISVYSVCQGFKGALPNFEELLREGGTPGPVRGTGRKADC